MRYIQGINRKSKTSLAQCVDDYISEDNSVRVIDIFVEALDTVKLGFKNAVPSDAGRLGYNPKDIIKLYLYGYLNSTTASRKLEAETKKNLEVIWLMKNLKPDHKVISDFRKDNKEALQNVFREFIALCKKWDLFGKELIAVDGSKFRASNSKKSNFSKKSIIRKIKYIDEKIEKYISEIDENDALDEATEKTTEEEIMQKVNQLKARKKLYEGYRQKMEEEGSQEISLVDSESRLMAVNNNGVDICYNVQTVVDSKHCLIVDCNVINNPTDHGQLSKMSIRAKKIFQVEKLDVLADKGYYNVDDLKICEEEKITAYVSKQVFSNSTGEREFYPDRFKYDKEKNVYVCPTGQELYCIRRKVIDENTKVLKYKNFNACKDCCSKTKCTNSAKGRVVTRDIDQDFLDIVDTRTKANKELYKQRQMIVEHPFGTVKRGWGLYYFITRGLNSVKTETSLTFLAYNFKRVMNIVGAKEMIRRLISHLKSIDLRLQDLCFTFGINISIVPYNTIFVG